MFSSGSPATAQCLVSCQGLSFSPPQARERIIYEFNIRLHPEPRGRSISFLGPSGCGKSTLLRLLAGLERPAAGEVSVLSWKNAELLGKCGMVFQDAGCFDWLTVLENATFSHRIRGVQPEKARLQGLEILRIVGLEKYASAYPRQLSAGMRQRLAIARALIGSPIVLLMDEPFSALDAITREELQVTAVETRLQKESNFLVVTHDVEESVFLSDEVVVFTGKPLRVVAHHIIPVPAEARTTDFRLSTLFIQLVREIRESLQAARMLST